MKTLNNLIGDDIKLMRDRYDEALKLQGVPCVYMYPVLPDTNAQGESVVDQYSLPIDTSIFFEGSPKIRTFKRLGWVVENNQDLPFLIHCSFHLPHVQRDAIFKIAGQYTELPERVFKVTEISYDVQAPDHIICQVIPVYENQIVGRTKKEVEQTFNTSEHFIKQPIDYRGDYITTSTKHRRKGQPRNFLGNVVGVGRRKNMLKVSGSDIQVTRGDSAYFNIEILCEDGTKYYREPGDKLVFTVKRSYNSDYEYIQKEIPELALILSGDDTRELDYGNYWYDIELTTADGGVYTVVGPARFIMREEVTF